MPEIEVHQKILKTTAWLTQNEKIRNHLRRLSTNQIIVDCNVKFATQILKNAETKNFVASGSVMAFQSLRSMRSSPATSNALLQRRSESQKKKAHIQFIESWLLACRWLWLVFDTTLACNIKVILQAIWNCYRELRFVKCAGNHNPGQCKRNSRDDGSAPLKCANYKGNHPANSLNACLARHSWNLWISHHQQWKVVHNKSIHQLPQSSTWGVGKPDTAVNALRKDQSEPNERLIRSFTEKNATLHNTIKEMQSEIDTLRSELSQTKLQQRNTTKPTRVSEVAGRLFIFSGKSSSSPSANSVKWTQIYFYFYNDARFL